MIEYKDKKFFFACDTGYGGIYKELGEKYGPIDLTFINIGAYNFYPMATPPTTCKAATELALVAPVADSTLVSLPTNNLP